MIKIFKYNEETKEFKQVKKPKIVGRDHDTNRPIYEPEIPNRLSMFDYTPNELLRR